MSDISRREALKAGAAAGSLLALGGCAKQLQRLSAKQIPEDLAPPSTKDEPAVRLLNRAAFGPGPGEAQKVREAGTEPYVDAQLRADEPEPAYLVAMLHRLDAFRIDAAELQDLPESTILGQLQQAAILRAVYSPNQLRERMSDLWTNHFNIYARKAKGAYFKPTDELKVVRENALGKFPDLLRASAKSPAMLRYLDNQRNKRGVPNENYARELLELHTLGVDGGYEYQDIKELARCLTGWTVEDRFLRPYGKWRFDPELHDDGSKKLLGTNIPSGLGERDMDVVLDLLATHPSTSKFIAKKICRYFLGADAGAMIPQVAKVYRDTRGDIRAMLRPVLLSKELEEGSPILKRPFDFVVSALRVTGADTDGEKPLRNHLERMGQPLYEWPMPDGYPDKTSAWTGSLLARWNFCLALTDGAIAGTSVPLDQISASTGQGEGTAAFILNRPINDAPVKRARDAASDGIRSEIALALSSPEFQWR